MPKTSRYSKYGWNETAGRYINLTTGRFVKSSAIKDELEAVVTKSREEISVLSQKLRDGKITLAEWQVGMRDQIKAGHTAAAASARGGWGQMSQSDWGAAGKLIRDQYAALNKFAADIESGKAKLDGRFMSRSDMYGQAIRCTYETSRERYATVYKGAVEERRVLEPGAEHCETSSTRPGCVELAAKGWQPVGTLPRIGAATCITHCKCRFELRDQNGKVIGE